MTARHQAALLRGVAVGDPDDFLLRDAATVQEGVALGRRAIGRDAPSLGPPFRDEVQEGPLHGRDPGREPVIATRDVQSRSMFRQPNPSQSGSGRIGAAGVASMDAE